MTHHWRHLLMDNGRSFWLLGQSYIIELHNGEWQAREELTERQGYFPTLEAAQRWVEDIHACACTGATATNREPGE